jgi:hypothetical protein
LKFLLALLFLLPITHAIVNVEGTCNEFIISIEEEREGCWDIKVDSPGQVLGEEWKSSFFYVDSSFCDGEGQITFIPETRENVDSVIKLRQNSTVDEVPFIIKQNCQDNTDLLFPIIGIIMVILAVVIYFWRRP